VHFLAGNKVTRLCGSVTGLTLSYQDKEFKGIQEMPPGRKTTMLFSLTATVQTCATVLFAWQRSPP